MTYLPVIADRFRLVVFCAIRKSPILALIYLDARIEADVAVQVISAKLRLFGALSIPDTFMIRSFVRRANCANVVINTDSDIDIYCIGCYTQD